MVSLLKAFTIISEFKFDIAQAMIESDTLIGQVGKISETANSALATLQNLGLSFAMNLSGAGGGVLGIIGSAIKSTDKFKNSQLSLSNVISANIDNLTGSVGTFNDRMLVSKNIMKDIIKDARKFSVPAKSLLEATKLMSAVLVPKGLAGDNFINARNMSRNLLKAAPNLGVNPNQVYNQLIDAIQGRASMQGRLMPRLFSESKDIFEKAGVKDTKGFNALKTAKRFKILNEALNKFTSDTEVLTARANTLSGIMRRINDTFTGFSSILKPLGDAIMPPLVEILNTVIDYLQTEGAQVIKLIANFIAPLISNPKKIVVQLMALGDVTKNIVRAGYITGLALTLTHLSWTLKLIQSTAIGSSILTGLSAFLMKIPILGGLLLGVGRMFTWIGGILHGLIGGGFIAGFTKMLGLFGLLFTILHAISKSVARAKLNAIAWFARNLAELTKIMTDIGTAIKVILSPFNDITDGLSYLFGIIIEGTYTLDIAKSSARTFADMMVWFAERLNFGMAVIKGSINSVAYLISDFLGTINSSINMAKNGNVVGAVKGLGTFSPMESMIKGFEEEFYKSLDKTLFPIDNGAEDSAVVKNVTNIGKVEIKNDFKDQMQPDRVALSIKEQLMKTANNPTKASGKTISSGLRGGFGVHDV